MHRSIFLARALVAIALTCCFGSATRDLSAAESKPNVILIVADDLGGVDLGCYGSKFHRTPNLDRLAAEGVRFSESYAACPVCSPTRAALMTGKWPARLHLTDWLPGRPDMPSQKLNRPVIRQQLPLEEITLAEAFKSAGYATGHIGKWHLGGEGFGPKEQGFDSNIAGGAAGSPQSYFAPFKRGNHQMPGLEDAPEGEYLTDRLTTEALKFIDKHAAEPFFLYLPHYAVHIPLNAKPEMVAKYPPEAPFNGSQNNPIYAAMLESLDEGVGKILEKLKQQGLDERTIVVFTSDNGGLAVLEGPHTPATSNAPYREGKGFLYEGGVRVPLIVKWPGQARAGSVSKTPVCSVDLFPTLLEICGISTDAKPDGRSLVSELRGQAPLERDALYWHYPHYANQGGRPGAAVREGDFKLIEYYETGRRELFDVAHDLSESQNLSEKHPEIVERLAAKLAAWREAVGAQMPTPNPKYSPNAQDDKGNITLPAKTADVHGTMVRFEPLPHKNTLGFWVRREDWVSWEFDVKTPGQFEVEALQGCGKGSGGAEVLFEVGDQKLSMIVEDTGHFQNFIPRKLGTITLDKPGRYTMTVKPQTKPGVAVMDLRQMVLRKVP